MKRPVHFEICTENPEQIGAFYGKVLGWETTSPPGPMAYWLVKTGDEGERGIDGGIMGRHFDQRVINTMDVESLDAAIEQVEANGGKLVHGPNEIPKVGLHAYCADPDGNLFGLIQHHAGS